MQRFEVWVSTLVCIWCTFSCVSDRGGCLAEVLFLSREAFIHANSPWTNIKLPAHITRHEFASEVKFNRIAARNLG